MTFTQEIKKGMNIKVGSIIDSPENLHSFCIDLMKSTYFSQLFAYPPGILTLIPLEFSISILNKGGRGVKPIVL